MRLLLPLLCFAVLNNFVHDCFGEGVLVMSDKVGQTDRFGALAIRGNTFAFNGRYSVKHQQEITVASCTAQGTIADNRFCLRPGNAAIHAKLKPEQQQNWTSVGNRGEGKVAGAMTWGHAAFCAQPRVTAIEHAPGKRSFTFTTRTPGATLGDTTDGSLPMPDSPALSGPVTLTRSDALTVTVDRSTPILWVDGEFRRAGTATRRDLRPGTLLGANWQDAVRDVRIYDRVLTVAEIQLLAQEQL